mmetsp:Transcript_15001/g.50321  ORF Transcript_15001/g.50321 Transcript_15001/m.50321 type:complete len:293 (-) Transcript_15001:21-899(-)
MQTKVGFVGVGIMGNGMVRRLLLAGREVVVWNRDAAKAEAIVADFPDLASIAATPAAVVDACAVTYSMLSTLEASEAVFPGLLSAVGPGKAVVDCATLTPERMATMAAAVTEKGGRFLEAPVSGSKAPAEAGALIFLCGGDAELYAECQADLKSMGKADFFFGAVPAGTKMKLVVNMVMGEMMVALSEGMSLAGAAGLPTDAEAGLLKILDLSSMSNGVFRGKGPSMEKGVHPAAFPLKHAQKDMRFALGLADSLDLSLPGAAAANAQFLRARKDHGDEDFSAVHEVIKPAL